MSRYDGEGCHEDMLAYQKVAAVGLVAPPAYAAAPPPRDVAIAGRLSGRIKRPIEHEPQTAAAKNLAAAQRRVSQGESESVAGGTKARRLTTSMVSVLGARLVPLPLSVDAKQRSRVLSLGSR